MTIDTGGAADARFEFGRVVGQTFGLIGRNFVMFVLLALVFVGAPQFGVLYYQSTTALDPNSIWVVLAVATLVNIVTTYVLQGALTRAAVDDLSGKGVNFGSAIADGLRYFFPLIIVAILASLGMFVGFLLLLIPGIILAVMWCVTAPIVVIERIGPTSSIGRSSELTKGRRWAVFGLLLLYVVFAYAVQIVLGLVLQSAGEYTVTGAIVWEGLGPVFAAVSAAIAAVLTLVSSVGTAALYFELRRVKEGVGVDEIAAVFD